MKPKAPVLGHFENEMLYVPSPFTVVARPKRTVNAFTLLLSDFTLVAQYQVQPFQLSSAQSGFGINRVTSSRDMDNFRCL
jgi:hypothetical protein